ncbi:MAG TPA: hypothetical protein VH300_01505 [Thermoleophilaceae bacterium]|jgi:hypothetical protein|nr:hypothetical protein [Thermoleophilaceae bacterium]
MSTEETEEQTGQQQDDGQEQPQGEGQSDERQKAQEAEEKHERAKAKMEEVEKDPPDKLEDWPDDEAKYETFGGSEDQSGYDEHHEEALGEHSVRHHDDGSVEVKGEEVDNPDEYKGDPIPGGPTDPEAPAMPGEEKEGDEASGESKDEEKQTDD